MTRRRLTGFVEQLVYLHYYLELYHFERLMTRFGTLPIVK